jgi:uncharacterized transporter YbjL
VRRDGQSRDPRLCQSHRADRPDVGYAMIFPSMTIVKILFVQVAAALASG